jgi:hypothetical protein
MICLPLIVLGPAITPLLGKLCPGPFWPAPACRAGNNVGKSEKSRLMAVTLRCRSYAVVALAPGIASNPTKCRFGPTFLDYENGGGARPARGRCLEHILELQYQRRLGQVSCGSVSGP